VAVKPITSEKIGCLPGEELARLTVLQQIMYRPTKSLATPLVASRSV
jgi:hypothetical protein